MHYYEEDEEYVNIIRLLDCVSPISVVVIFETSTILAAVQNKAVINFTFSKIQYDTCCHTIDTIVVEILELTYGVVPSSRRGR